MLYEKYTTREQIVFQCDTGTVEQIVFQCDTGTVQ